MADLFALGCIHEELLFRNDDYVSPEKAKAIKRLRCVVLLITCSKLALSFVEAHITG